MPRAQRGAAGRRGPLPWVSRGSSGIVCRIKENAVATERAARRRTAKSRPAARSRRSGKVARGKFRSQHCDVLLSLVSPVGGGSRFRVLEDPESDDCASATAPRPAAPRPAAPRPAAPRPAAPRPAAPRPAAPHPAAPRPAAPRPAAPRPDAPRPAAPRPDVPRPDAPRPDAPRPDAPRPRNPALQQVSATAPRPAAPRPAAPHPDAPRPRKTTLQQVSATDVNRVSSSRKQDDDTSVTWSGARGRTETRRIVHTRCATRSAARRPSAIRSDMRGRAMTRSAAAVVVTGGGRPTEPYQLLKGPLNIEDAEDLLSNPDMVRVITSQIV